MNPNEWSEAGYGHGNWTDLCHFSSQSVMSLGFWMGLSVHTHNMRYHPYIQSFNRGHPETI